MTSDPIAFRYKGKLFCSTCWLWRKNQQVEADGEVFLTYEPDPHHKKSASHPGTRLAIPAGSCAKCARSFQEMHSVERPLYPTPVRGQKSGAVCRQCGCTGEDPEAGCAEPIKTRKNPLELRQEKRKMI